MAGAATVEKALDVLFHLHASSAAQGLSEIGRALNLPKSSCHRLLASLADREIVERDETGRYRPGLALLSLGIGAQRREPVVSAARPVLEAESARLGETVFLVGERHGVLRVLDKVEGPGFLRAAPGVGDVVPSEVTAAGELYRVFRDGGGETGTAAEAEVRGRGFSVNRDRWIAGLSVLGVPVWQAHGGRGREIAAVLALAAASPRFDALGERHIADQLLAAAREIGGRLGADSPGRGMER